MKKIYYITAPTSSGKTTTAFRLSEALHLPVVHADSVYHMLRDKYNPSCDPGKLTDYRYWDDPTKFGLKSWGEFSHINDAKFEMYEKLLEKYTSDFIIEGFTLSFPCEREIIEGIIGSHVAIIIRIQPSFTRWTELYIKRNKDESVRERSADYNRLCSCFTPRPSDKVYLFTDPEAVTADLLQ